jgi:hypothetical protein
MEVLVDNGVFYEFVPRREWGRPGARRLAIDQVETGVQYSVVVSTNAGLWAHDIDDVVEFTSVTPPRLLFRSRRSTYLNALAEHTGGHEVSAAVAAAARATGARVAEFTVGPVYPTPACHAGRHQYVVEFEKEPAGGLAAFAERIDQGLKQANDIYRLKRRDDGVLAGPRVTAVARGTFEAWMDSRGKLGGQNKVPITANDRRFVEGLLQTAADRQPHLSTQGPPGAQKENR